MYADVKFKAFLKSLENDTNKDLLECIAKGYLATFEDIDSYGNIYRLATGQGDPTGSGMITEDAEEKSCECNKEDCEICGEELGPDCSVGRI